MDHSAERLKRLGKLVREQREHLGLRQDQMRDYRGPSTGPSTTTLTKVENGTAPGPSPSTLRKLDFVFGWKPGTARGILDGGPMTLVDPPREPAGEGAGSAPDPGRASLWQRQGDDLIGGELDLDDEANLSAELLRSIDRIVAQQGASPSQLARLAAVKREIEQTQRLLAPVAHIPEVQARYARLMFRFSVESLLALSKPVGPASPAIPVDWAFEAPTWVDPEDPLTFVRLLDENAPDRIRLLTSDELAAHDASEVEILGTFPAVGSQSDFDLAAARDVGAVSQGRRLRDEQDRAAEAPSEDID